MIGPVLLVRHTAVAKRWHGRCYGSSDAGLSREGLGEAHRLAGEMAAWSPDQVIHSGLRRTRILATLLARRLRVEPVARPAWQERDFGDWEGQSWTAIYRATGNAMDGMIDAPGSFRPGGGETTMELGARAMAAFDRLPAARIAVITHGGPIAAIIGTLRVLPPRDWPSLVPPTGGYIAIERGSNTGLALQSPAAAC